MNTKETCREWTDIIDTLRTELNKIRKIKKLPDPRKPTYNFPFIGKEPKLKVGDFVHVVLDKPRNAFNEITGGSSRQGNFRHDPVPRIFYYPACYRYLVCGIENASYAEWELLMSAYKEEKKLKKLKQLLTRILTEKKDNNIINIIKFGFMENKKKMLLEYLNQHYWKQ